MYIFLFSHFICLSFYISLFICTFFIIFLHYFPFKILSLSIFHLSFFCSVDFPSLISSHNLLRLYFNPSIMI
jgi:hypothetical protein